MTLACFGAEILSWQQSSLCVIKAVVFMLFLCTVAAIALFAEFGVTVAFLIQFSKKLYYALGIV